MFNEGCNRVDKKLIHDRFAGHFATYEHEAIVQKKIALTLAQKISDFAGQPLGRVFEAGCGTGFLTKELATRGLQTLFLNDLVEEVLAPLREQLREKGFAGDLQLMPGDVENIAWPQDLDAVVSASAVQWFTDLPQFLRRASCVLKKGGLLAFSHFGPENLHQIRALTGMGLTYPDHSDLRKMLEDDYEINELSEETYCQEFSAPLQVLRHLQQTGVTGIANTFFRWTKQRLRDFDAAYISRFSCGEKVYLTWHIHYVLCQKRAQ